MNRHTPTRTVLDASMITTLRSMRELAQRGKKDLEVRALVEQLNADVAEGDYASELLAIYYWVTQNVRYMRDIDGVEFLKTPRKLLETRSGDCDDIATLLAAMFMAAGNPVQFAVASFKPGKPVFSHVFVEVLTPHGPVIFDPVANRDTKKMLTTMRFKGTFPVSQGPGTVDAGVGAAPHVGEVTGGNVYSVFDYHRGLYDYFEAPTGALPATGRYRKPIAVSRFGIAPESMAAPLPSGARKVGSGERPRGMIAHSSTGFGALMPIDQRSLGLVVVGAGLGILGYRMWSQR
jgi:predicted transglutaminase-like cysteine proteinase